LGGVCSVNDIGNMIVEAEIVCPQSVPVLDVQYISSSQAVSFSAFSACS
jgi:hypothetical protein